MNILVINAGSSSLKYQLFDMSSNDVLAKGLCERIGIDGRIKHSPKGKNEYISETPMKNHADAIRLVTELLVSPEHGVISNMSEIGAVGHRVVHAAEYYSKSVLIDDVVLKALNDCIPLAPLHNPPNLTGISACTEVLGNVPQAAVFDTAFHQTMPIHAYLYALPYEYYERLKVRRYGFHGTSHKYVSARAAEFVGRPIEDLKIVTCHLGNGSSVTAIKNGKSVDTSMGFTPLEGTPMGTRSGSIDPAILQYIMDMDHIGIDELTKILNSKSGVLGVSGESSDFRDLSEAADKGKERSATAIKMFTYSVTKLIGSYAAAMGGIDLLVFTAGIGENSKEIRADICENLGFMGLHLDAAKNNIRGKEAYICTDSSPNKILVIPTDEEYVIASETYELVNK